MFTKAKKIVFTTAVAATLCAGNLLSPLVALADDATGPVPAEMQNHYLLPLGMPIVSEVAPYTYDQMGADLITLSKFYGSHMDLRSLGKTFDNRDIWLSQYLDQTAIHFVPMVNPDGVTISQAREAGIISPKLRQIVNNVYQTSGGGSYTLWKSNARGVDLNHNFDASWHLITSPGQPSSRDYRGEVPLSEPEAAALASVVQMYPIKTCLNYHSMGRIIYWDVAGNQQRESSLQLARMFSQATGYGISGEPGVGGFKDWLQIKNNPIPSITLEVGRSACPVPLSQFPEIWVQNRGGVALALQFVQTQ